MAATCQAAGRPWAPRRRPCGRPAPSASPRAWWLAPVAALPGRPRAPQPAGAARPARPPTVRADDAASISSGSLVGHDPAVAMTGALQGALHVIGLVRAGIGANPH